MILTNGNFKLSSKYILFPENIYINDSIFSDFFTTQKSGCIYLNVKCLLDIRRTLFNNISTSITWSTSYSGAAIFTEDQTTNALIAETCFYECCCYHGYSFGLYGTGSAVLNQSSRSTSLSFSGLKHPSFLSGFQEETSSGFNTTHSLDGGFAFLSESVSIKYFQTLNSVAADFKDIYKCLVTTNKASIDLASFVNGTAPKVFISTEGLTVGTVYVDIASPLGSGILSVGCLYFTSRFPIAGVGSGTRKELVNSRPDIFSIAEVHCSIRKSAVNYDKEVLIAMKTILLFLMSIYN